MRYRLSGGETPTDRCEAPQVYHDEVRALLQDMRLPLSSGVEWIIERMEARGREAT